MKINRVIFAFIFCLCFMTTCFAMPGIDTWYDVYSDYQDHIYYSLYTKPDALIAKNSTQIFMKVREHHCYPRRDNVEYIDKFYFVDLSKNVSQLLYVQTLNVYMETLDLQFIDNSPYEEMEFGSPIWRCAQYASIFASGESWSKVEEIIAEVNSAKK